MTLDNIKRYINRTSDNSSKKRFQLPSLKLNREVLDTVRSKLHLNLDMSKRKVKPTQYPFVPFHLLRSAQLLSSIVVASIMFYYIGELVKDGYSVPWTFIFLLAVSLATIVALTVTILLHCFFGLNPFLNVFLNGILFVIWASSWCSLTYWMSGTLRHVCNKENWDGDIGIMVCRLYKTLFSFALLGFVSTLGAALLDIYVFRRATERGRYNQMQDLDHKQLPTEIPQWEPAPATRSAPVHLDGHFSAEAPKSAKGAPDGYEMPPEQFDYDTGYHSVPEERAEGSAAQEPPKRQSEDKK